MRESKSRALPTWRRPNGVVLFGGKIMAGADGFEPPMRESESRALPLGHAPLRGGKFGVTDGDRTHA